MSRTVSIVAHTTCSQCRARVYVNGPMRNVRCTACVTQIELPDGLWKDLGLEICVAYSDLRPDAIEATTVSDHGRELHAEIAPTTPRCEGCNAALQVVELADGETRVETCVCGRRTTASRAPAWLNAVFPESVSVYVPEPVASTPTGGEQALVLPCPHCGGSLHPGGDDARTIGCTYCNVDVYLPDLVWHRLHPGDARTTWYLELTGPPSDAFEPTRTKLDARIEHEIPLRLRTAWVAVALVVAVMAAVLCWELATSPLRAHGLIAIGVETAAIALGVAFAARPLALRMLDTGALIVRAGVLPLIGLGVPIAGQLVALVAGVVALSGRQLQAFDRDNAQVAAMGPAEVELVRRLRLRVPRPAELRPLGIALLAIATLHWAIVALVLRGS